MNLILLHPKDFLDENTAQLQGRRLKHILQVHRAQVGDQLRVGMVNGLMGKGEVTSLSGDRVELRVDLCEAPPEPRNLTLLLALPRPKNLGRILQTVTTLGIKRVFLFHSYQVEKSFWTSDLLSEENIRRHLILGLEQARDTVMPVVEKARWFKPFVEDQVPAIIEGTSAWVAHPVADQEAPIRIAGPVTLAIGPEGGFIPFEIDLFAQQGVASVKMGSRILKVETAVTSLVSRLT